MVPVIGIPPILAATVPLKSGVTRAELRTWHYEIMSKLQARGLHIVSYNVDGVETERGLTHEIQRDACTKGEDADGIVLRDVAGEADSLDPGLGKGRWAGSKCVDEQGYRSRAVKNDGVV